MTRQLFVIILFLFTSTLSYANVKSVTASVDQNNILLDESVTLRIIANGSTDRNALDLSPLSSDFQVGSPSFGQSTQIINGVTSRSSTWTVRLFPKKTGTLIVPSLEIEGKQTNAFAVTVLPVNAATKQRTRDFYVEAEVDKNSVYVQQQLIYTLKVYLAKEWQRASLSMPTIDDAIIEQIGEDAEAEEIINGIRYRTIERKFSVIPQSSGQFVIDGPIFEAQVLTRPRQSFSSFGRTETITRRAPQIDLDVLAIPDNYAYSWLPSKFVDVAEEWQSEEQEFRVGEPITRSITITAQGLTKEQLPDINTIYHPSFKAYPEQPLLSDAQVKDSWVSQGIYNTAIIPSEAGTFVIPEFKLAWFNVDTQMTEYAIIPSRSIEVLAAHNNQATNNSAVTDAPNLVQTQEQIAPVIVTEEQNNWLVYILASTNLLTLVLLIVVFLMRLPKPNDASKLKPSNTSEKSMLSESQAFTSVQGMLDSKDNTKIKHHLAIWLKLLLKEDYHSISTSLAKYAQGKDSVLELYNQLLAIDFSNTSNELDYEKFKNALVEYREWVLQGSECKPALKKLYS